MSHHLSDLRNRPGVPARVGSMLFSGIREVEATRQPFADWWEDRNRAALGHDGPLWLALGDSTSQGIGASDPEQGWVPRVQERLREATGAPWRVVNLSITGAKMDDVVERQLPAHDRLAGDGTLERQPDLVTCFIGANDVLSPLGVRRAGVAAERLIGALPPRALLSKVGSGPLSRPKASAINDAYRRGRDDGHVGLFQPWDWPTIRGAWAQDRFHPNDQGYEYLTEAIWPSVAAHVAQV